MSPVENKHQSNLAKKILLVMADVGTLKKDKRNDFHNYQYASDELIVGAIREALIKHSLSITTSQKSCTEISQKTSKGEDQLLTKLEMEFELTDADSGESKVVTFFGYGTDKADKGVYKAMTGAEKYFLMKTFLIATPDDPEFEKTQRAARQAYSGQAQSSTPKPSTPAPVTTNSAEPPKPKVEQKIVKALLKDVTQLKSKETGKVFYKLNGVEGESWITFSETVAKNAKDFAARGTYLAIALEMNARGPVVAGIKPA